MNYRINLTISSVGPSYGMRVVEMELLNPKEIDPKEFTDTLLATLEGINPELKNLALVGNLPLVFSGDLSSGKDLLDEESMVLVQDIMEAISRPALDFQVHTQGRKPNQLKPPYYVLVTYGSAVLADNALYYDNFNQVQLIVGEQGSEFSAVEIARHPFSVALLPCAAGVVPAHVEMISKLFPTIRVYLALGSASDPAVVAAAVEEAFKSGIRVQTHSAINVRKQVFPALV